MSTFDKLVDLFRAFPGIGARQAKRFAYFLLAKDKAFTDEIVRLISSLRKEIKQCESCFRYFEKTGSRALCPICADKNRDDTLFMVVATNTDLEAIEKSRTYHGRYFVLGGVIPLIERKTTEKLRIKELVSLINGKINPRESAPPNPRKSAVLKEIILALSANPDGEHTDFELRRILAPIVSAHKIAITTLGRGLSTGSELEYADQDTIKSAFKNRSAQNP